MNSEYRTAVIVALLWALLSGILVAEETTTVVKTECMVCQTVQTVITEYERQTVDEINRYRMQAGLKPLVLDEKGCLLARIHSNRMASARRLFHASGYWECVATIGGGPSSVVALWMNSPPHRAILMSRSATRISFGSFGAWHTARVR